MYILIYRKLISNRDEKMHTIQSILLCDFVIFLACYDLNVSHDLERSLYSHMWRNYKENKYISIYRDFHP